MQIKASQNLTKTFSCDIRHTQKLAYKILEYTNYDQFGMYTMFFKFTLSR